jgi:hypothetical protein
MIQQRRGVLSRYEIRMPEIKDWQVGMVEKYLTADDKVRWRTLDHWKCDWKSGFLGREAAAQDLVANCPRTVQLIADRRRKLTDSAEQNENCG